MPLGMDVAEVAEMLVRHANLGDQDAVRYAELLSVGGFSSELRDQLVLGTQRLELTTAVCIPDMNEDWTESSVLPFQFFSGNRDELFALATVRILMAKYAQRVHKCLLKDCGTYFVGDPRSKWCITKKCGNIYHATKNRNPAKARTMIRRVKRQER